MKFFTQIKTKLKLIAEHFSSDHVRLEKIIETNNEMLESHLKLVKESNSGILSLKQFGDQESPGLKLAFINLSDALKEIEIARTAMVKILQEKFIQPVNQLLESQKERNKAEILRNGHEEAYTKAKEKLEKIQQKSAEELKEGELEKAQNYVAEMKELYEDAVKTYESLKISLEKKKIESTKELLKILVLEYRKLHRKAVEHLSATSSYIEEINIKEETYSALFQPIPALKDPTYLNAVKTLFEDIQTFEKGLLHIQKANNRLLKAHLNLQEETRDGIESFQRYAMEENPEIKQAIETFADGLTTIESNRQAFVVQMQSQFLDPIQETIDEGKKLQVRIKSIQDMHKKLDKWIANLKKIREKPSDKVSEGELPEAKENVARYEEICAKHHDYLVRETHMFTMTKIETFKNSLMAILERNLQFHDQASNIIDSCEKLVDDIKIEHDVEEPKNIEEIIKPSSDEEEPAE